MKKNIYKRRDILIGASAITAVGVLAACKDEVSGGTPSKPKNQLISQKISYNGEWLLHGLKTFQE